MSQFSSGEHCSPIETIVKSVRLSTNYLFINISFLYNKNCIYVRFVFANKPIGEPCSPLHIIGNFVIFI